MYRQKAEEQEQILEEHQLPMVKIKKHLKSTLEACETISYIPHSFIESLPTESLYQFDLSSRI
ncbi:MAG: hypothetical protein H7X94_05565 [Vallitaleaceae bacterium]|nr:hypothetical protein [Vallitaleaceae bacterium]